MKNQEQTETQQVSFDADFGIPTAEEMEKRLEEAFSF